MPVIRTPVESSQIASIGYESETSTLEVEFKGSKGKPNSVYQYVVDDAVWRAFRDAQSKGSHYAKFIKGKFPSKKSE